MLFRDWTMASLLLSAVSNAAKKQSFFRRTDTNSALSVGQSTLRDMICVRVSVKYFSCVAVGISLLQPVHAVVLLTGWV